MFQFHSGLIKSRCGEDIIESSYICFNSILVWLKALSQQEALQFITRFNSILVWLKDAISAVIGMLIVGFQFHSGLIKRIPKVGLLNSNKWSFNSILVWLKGCNNQSWRGYASWFQFHSGLIKRASSQPSWIKEKLFQFHSGLIKSAINQISSGHSSGVSIPFWSD